MVRVCVPAYEPPGMLRQLVTSFLNQEYPRKELVISDDSRSDDLQQMGRQFPQTSIRYARNPKSLGYGANLRASIKRAAGECVALMGDHDMFLAKDALSRYADALGSNPEVCCIASNRLHFSRSCGWSTSIANDRKLEYFGQELRRCRVFG